ncbi:MAG TPA: DUF305 domain-containing protein [Streptosporangiaceae bacterium]|nr:DUF305 domain-containing protein [Streptosporangiaceae bacterium]
MKRQQRWLAAGGAAVIAAALAACGSSATPAGTTTSAAPASTPAAAFNAADVAFTTGMLRLENQAQAMAALVPGHTTTTQLRQFAAHLREHDSSTQHMREMMGEWHQPTPAPDTPGTTPVAGMGPGMMGSHDWDEMAHQYGHDFNDHWLDAMIANHTAEITLCRAELRSGASPQARALARTTLAQRQAELAQLHRWHHDQEHNGEHD